MPIAAAVMASASVRNDKPLAKKIEEAMAAAVAVAMEEGIKDPAEIKARMLAARDDILAAARAPKGDE